MIRISTRKIFFWLLTLFFLATASVVIFYAFGYRFNFERGIFVYTGAITIKSSPQEADIYIDGKQVSNKKTNYLNNSCHINGLRPQEHLLEIKAPEHRAWSKKVAVHSGVSTEFWNILLVKEDYPRENYSASGIEKFFISPKNKRIAYIQNDKNSQEFLVKILDIEAGLPENIFTSLEYKFSSDGAENIEWSPQAHKIIIPAEKEELKYYFIVDTETKLSVNLKDIIQADKPRNVRWDPSRKDCLFYSSDKNLYRLNLKNPEEGAVIAQNIAGYDLSSSGAYYLQANNGIVYKADLENGKSKKQITTSPAENAENSNWRIIVYDEKRIALIDNSEHLYVYNKGEKNEYFNRLSENTVGVQFSNDGKKLLYWTDREIFVYFTRDWDVQPLRQENEIKNITRFFQEIKNVQWSKKYEHIIFTAGPSVKIIELDCRDRRNMVNIIKLNSANSEVIINSSENTLYFTDLADSDNPLFDLYSIEFPEKNGFLGR